MKQPNGYGSITRLTGKRRKPFMVRTACTYDTDGTALKESRQILGYYATKKEALIALAEYNQNPYDLSAKKLTLGDIVKKWKAESKLSANTMRGYVHSLDANMSKYYDVPITDITLEHIQNEIDVQKNSMQGVLRNALSAVWDCALRHDIVSKNVPKFAQIEAKRSSNLHHPFTDNEIRQLWDHVDNGDDGAEIYKVALALIYSGWRINELLNLTEIDYENLTMQGGLKTKSGKNRIVPIHHKIISIVRELDGTVINNLNYDQLRPRWDKLITNHTMHDTRHTFVSILQSKRADHITIQKLVGHASNVTDDVYTHKSIEELRKTIEMID